MDMGSANTNMPPMPTGLPSNGMDAMEDLMGGCKINMLWNWYTVDACFIAESWHIRSNGMFAGCCIGVILLVFSLEFLRRAGKEYDRYLVAQYRKSLDTTPTAAAAAAAGASKSSASSDHGADKTPGSPTVPAAACAPAVAQTFRPSVLQQAVRALLHMLQFAVAYFVMLLAMYYNGYFIICIFIGAFLGYFIFGWQSLTVGRGGNGRMEEDATVCCG